MIEWLLAAQAVLAAPAGAAEPAGAVRLSLADQAIDLTAACEPLTDTVYGLERRYAFLRDLAPAAARATWRAEAFRPLLPREPVAVGDAWRLDVAPLLPLLRQLHPGATERLHHYGGFASSAEGGHAILRALDDSHAEVLFRLHAEFLLAGDGGWDSSSWLTPSQLRGRMVLDRARGKVVAFELAVPPASANADVNVAEGGQVLADIGRIPRMSLSGGAFPAFDAGAKEIDPCEADVALARRFYPFAALDWLPLPLARAESLATGKPLHVIALFGSLADESC